VPVAFGVKGQNLAALSVWDRIVFGALSGLVGALLGIVAGFLAAVFLDFVPFAPAAVIFSTLYFFCIGAVRGPNAGFFAGEALGVVGALGAAEAGVIPGNSLEHHQPSAWSSVWLLGVWFAIVVLLMWRG
jgi:hypothetical protein